MLENTAVHQNAPLVQIFSRFQRFSRFNIRNTVPVVDRNCIAAAIKIFGLFLIDDGNIGIMTAMEMKDFIVINILHRVAACQQNVRLIASLDK